MPKCNYTVNIMYTSYTDRYNYACDCSAIAGTGILYTDVTTPTVQRKPAIFTAEVDPSYRFVGWYSDEAYTTLVSTDNPARVETPRCTGSTKARTSLTLYAKATPLSSTTGISLKRNGSWMETKSAYRKVNGAWVTDTDYCKTLLSQKDRIGTFVHIV